MIFEGKKLMKTIILNSGIGKRMGNLTKKIPKCLVKINDKETILSRQIKLLIQNGINEILITTGPHEEKIRDYINNEFPNLDVKYIHNNRYLETNYIYSLFLVNNLIDDDIILMHGDLVFDEESIKKIIESKYKNCVLVNYKAELPEKDFKGRVDKGRVKEISINIEDVNCFFFSSYLQIN